LKNVMESILDWKEGAVGIERNRKGEGCSNFNGERRSDCKGIRVYSEGGTSRRGHDIVVGLKGSLRGSPPLGHRDRLRRV